MDMSTDSPLKQLGGKRRTYEDLSRYIGAKATGSPNYSLLLGAGCSLSSNVRNASQLVEDWRRGVFTRLCPNEPYDVETAIDYLTKNQAVWYNPQREYSSLFEKNFDLPRQRRMFVEQEVAGKNPNLGYAYLVRLVEEGFINTIFTTNFDDLVNEAFFQFSQTRPIVCAHDSSVSSVTVTSKRPKVIKLHGDYLFDDIKSTVRETESLENNTRRKFIEFCRDFGLVIIGYGGFDRSVMDVLQYLLRSDDYFKHGIYWCIKKGDVPSDELIKLLWRERVYFIEIDGFDELMGSLHNDLIGKSLPIDTGVITNKPRAIIKGFCENPFLKDSPSPVIKRDLDRLLKQGEQEELFSALRDARGEIEEKGSHGSEVLNERELLIIFEIKQHLSSDLEAARLRITAELGNKPSQKLKEELAELRVMVEELAGDLDAAIAAVDSLIAEDPQEPENYIRKTYLLVDHEERIRILEKAETIDRANYRVYSRKVDCYIDAYEAGTLPDREALLKQIETNIEMSLQFEPGLRNPIWSVAITFYSNCDLPKGDIKEKMDEIVVRTANLGPGKIIALRARLARLGKYKEDRNSPAAEELLKDISNERLSRSKSLQPYYEWLELDAYRKLERREELSRRLSELSVNPDLANNREYYRRKAEFLLKFNGDLDAAIVSMQSAVELDGARVDILRLGYWLQLKKDSKSINELLAKRSSALRPVDRLALRRHECLAKDDVEGALAQLRASFGKRIVGASQRLEEVHDLLLLTRYEEAAKIGKAMLEQTAWNKVQFGEHILNYELSQFRLGGQNLSKKRLGELIEVCPLDEVKGCAYYLAGNQAKAKDIFVDLLRSDRENRFAFPTWAIFQDERGRAFIEGAINTAA